MFLNFSIQIAAGDFAGRIQRAWSGGSGSGTSRHGGEPIHAVRDMIPVSMINKTYSACMRRCMRSICHALCLCTPASAQPCRCSKPIWVVPDMRPHM